MAISSTESSPLFSRVVETRSTRSWRAAAPAVVVLVALVALLAYLASRLSSYSQQAAVAQRDAAAAHEQLDASQKRVATMEKDLNVARSPGRTTVLLEGQGKDKAWGAATWGEGEDGKSWVKIMAYGLKPAPEGKEYRAWLEPQSGAPADASKLDPTQDGSAFALGQDLPRVDQGKRLIVALEDADAKQPGEILMSANLPKLQPTEKPASAAASAAPAADQAASR